MRALATVERRRGLLTIRRRSLRKGLIAAGCVVGTVALPAAGVGLVLLSIGAGLHLWSKGCLEQNRRLTTAGPYRWTRNPFYFANLLVDLGLCCVIGVWWVALVYWPIWVIAYRETIAREERRLAELFPDEMPAYLEAVPALIPTRPGLARERSRGGFSWDNPALARGSEYARLLGIWLAPAAIWAGGRARSEGLALFDPRHGVELGLLVLLVVGWVIKLALAETFRRPATRLLPLGSWRWLRSGSAVVLVALSLAGTGLPASSPLLAGSALPLVALAIGLRSLVVLRLLTGAGALAIVLAIGVESERLWMVGLPVAWCLSLALDELGDARTRRVPRPPGRAGASFREHEA